MSDEPERVADAGGTGGDRAGGDVHLCRRELLTSAARLAGGAACLAAFGAAFARAAEGAAAAPPRLGAAPVPTRYDDAVLKKDFTRNAKYLDEVIAARHGKAFTRMIRSSARASYAELGPKVPYIGEADWPLPDTLIGSAVMLAYYRALRHAGIGKAEARGCIDKQGKAALADVPPEKLEQEGAEQFNDEWYAMEKQYAALSQRKLYPGDWVYSFVEGVPDEFDWGLDFTECGVLKFYAAQHALELMPPICVQDFYASAAMKTGLARTGTLARGAACCDFRYRQGRAVIVT